MPVFVGDISGAPLFGVVLLLVVLTCAAIWLARNRRKHLQARERQRRAFWGF
jgi:hypothetical protein